MALGGLRELAPESVQSRRRPLTVARKAQIPQIHQTSYTKVNLILILLLADFQTVHPRGITEE